jgi:hypothetical protein
MAAAHATRGYDHDLEHRVTRYAIEPSWSEMMLGHDPPRLDVA